MLENQSSRDETKADSQEEDLGFISKKPKITILIMFTILILGLIFILMNRKKAKESNSAIDHATIDQIMKVTDTIKIDYGLDDLFSVIDLEKQLKKVLEKDTLSSEDSLFIKNLDQKLNKLLNE